MGCADQKYNKEKLNDLIIGCDAVIYCDYLYSELVNKQLSFENLKNC